MMKVMKFLICQQKKNMMNMMIISSIQVTQDI